MMYLCRKCKHYWYLPGQCPMDKSILVPVSGLLGNPLVNTVLSDPKTFRTVVELGCYMLKKIL